LFTVVKLLFLCSDISKGLSCHPELNQNGLSTARLFWQGHSDSAYFSKEYLPSGLFESILWKFSQEKQKERKYSLRSQITDSIMKLGSRMSELIIRGGIRSA